MRRTEVGSLHEVYVIDSRPWVNVVPRTRDGDILLIEQYRHGTGRRTLEVPGGMVDAEEEPLQAAARELEEETGYGAGSIDALAVLDANPAIQSNQVHLFVAEDCSPKTAQRLDPMEDIAIRCVPEADIPGLLDEGAFCHPLTMAALLLYLRRG